MRALAFASTLCAVALLLAACGGGAASPLDGGSPSGKSTGVLTGEVVSIDGRTSALDGVLLSLRETGAAVATDLDGSFTFGDVPTGTLTIDVVSVPTFAAKGGDDAPGHDDDDPPHHDADEDGLCDEEGHMHQHGECFDEEEVEDGEDADEHDVTVHRVRAREEIHVRLRLENGEIGAMECVRDQDRERESEQAMTRTADATCASIKGKLEVESREDRERLKVRVERCDEGRQLELWAEAPNGAQEQLGVRTVNAQGEARWTFDTSEGARLPFGVGHVEDLEGYRFEVRNAGDGAVQLRANAPALPQARVRSGDDT